MRNLVFRTICVLLLCFGMMFSGVALIATAESPAATGAVNNHCNPDGAQSCPLPCTTPDCPLCVVCAIADTVQPVEIQTTFQIVEIEFPDVAQSISDPYLSEIFHPPRRENSIQRS